MDVDVRNAGSRPSLLYKAQKGCPVVRVGLAGFRQEQNGLALARNVLMLMATVQDVLPEGFHDGARHVDSPGLIPLDGHVARIEIDPDEGAVLGVHHWIDHVLQRKRSQLFTAQSCRERQPHDQLVSGIGGSIQEINRLMLAQHPNYGSRGPQHDICGRATPTTRIDVSEEAFRLPHRYRFHRIRNSRHPTTVGGIPVERAKKS